MNKAEKIIRALKDHLNIKTDKALAEYFGLEAKNVYSWKKNGNVTNTLIIFEKLRYLNPRWLETADDPMMILDKDNLHLVPDTAWKGSPLDPPPIKPSKIVAQIQPGKAEIKDKLLVERQQEPSPEAEADDIEELKRMSERVLRSKTVYRSAWASNCRAFYQAVIKEEEMMAKDARIEEMAVEIAEIKALLRRLVGDDQKREQKAG